MKTRMQNKILLTALMAGIAGAALAAPTQFTATATVQNAITITQTTQMNFGTVFATATGPAPASSTPTTDSQKLTLSPAGVITSVLATTPALALPPSVLGIGGTPTAGAFSAPGLPSNATVKINLYDASGAAFNNLTAATAVCTYDTPADALSAGKIVLNSAGDPSYGFFCLDAFTTDKANLLTTGYPLGTGVTALTFNLGATLIAQTPATGTAHAFQPGPHTGTFGMELSFP